MHLPRTRALVRKVISRKKPTVHEGRISFVEMENAAKAEGIPTEPQLLVLGVFIELFDASPNRAPTVIEVMERRGCSKTTAQHHVTKLLEIGLLERIVPGKAHRNFRPTERGRSFINQE